MRWTLRVLLVIVVIAVILLAGGYLYLHSHRVRDQVKAKLEAAYGGPVQIEEVNVGINSSSVTGVKLYEKGKETTQQPWASVEAALADVSLVKALEGTTAPQNIT